MNEYIIYSDYAEIVIIYKEKEIRTKIDIEDINLVNQYKWYFDRYIKTREGQYIHRIIMNCPNDLVVDHINGDKLDNRKENLRICTQQQNKFNHKTYKTNISGYSGISWHKKANKWRVRIQVDNKEIYLGLFDDLAKAIEVRKQAEEKYFGKYKRK